MVALAVLVSAGVAAAAMGRGGVTESRGVTSKPAREFRAPPRRARVAPAARPSVDSLAKSVGDSVALLIGPSPVPQRPASQSPEVNVPARGKRLDPRDQQIKQMLPDGATRNVEPEPPPPPMNLNTVGNTADVSAAAARARIDSATRKDVKPTFSAKTSSAARP